MAKKFYEHYKRSLAKAITFRMVILCADFIILAFITRRYDLVLSVILISNISSTALYFMHERFWNHIHWGKHHNGKAKK